LVVLKLSTIYVHAFVNPVSVVQPFACLPDDV